MTMKMERSRLPIGLIGAGGIGRMHVERAQRSAAVEIVAIADPSLSGREYALQRGIAAYADHREMLERVSLAAAIVATPNHTHVSIGLDCVAAGLPTLIEKPIADSVEDGLRLCNAAQAAGVPLLVGHQRRCNPLVRRARSLIDEGVLGVPVSASVLCTWYKPLPYFEASWRREPGGGPVLINLIHDIDLLRHLVGEIVGVQAKASNRRRGFEVEDTAAVLLEFANGALGTVTVSDTAVAPWNYDLAAGEAQHYARQDVDSYFLSGTEGSLTLPRLQVFRYRGPSGWHEPLSVERTPVHQLDPYAEQLLNLRAVVEGRESPRCTGLEGLKTLAATRAVLDAAASGQVVAPKVF